MSIYNCPNCKNRTFNPLTKALAGQLNSIGRNCPHCGKRLVNGKGATTFNAIFSLICFALIVFVYLKAPGIPWLAPIEGPVAFGLLAAKIIVPRIVWAFCFRLVPAIKLEYK